VERDAGHHLGDREGYIGEHGALYAALTGEGHHTATHLPYRASRLAG
jgi:hypothetical protein